MEDASDRRRSERVRLHGRTGGRAAVITEFKVLAMSETGASLEMSTPVALESQCDITLDLLDATVDVRGRVVQVEKTPSDVYRVSVDFVGLDSLDREALESFLERERQRPGP